MTSNELKSAIKEYLVSNDIKECSTFFCEIAQITMDVLQEDAEMHFQCDAFPNFPTFTQKEIKANKDIALLDSIIDTISSGSLFQDGDIYLVSVLFIKKLHEQLEAQHV